MEGGVPEAQIPPKGVGFDVQDFGHERIARKGIDSSQKLGRHRWVVERTFAWLGKYRRLSKDYERCIASSEGMIYIGSIHILLNRLTV